MASPPFAIAETTPQDSDVVLNYPLTERTYRDVVESWLTFLSNPTDGIIKTTALPTYSFVEGFHGFLGVPVNKAYLIGLKMPHGGTITETVTKCISGTCTATFKIDSTNLGGTANAVSSVEQAQAHASANVFTAGQDLWVTVSANAACLDMSFTIKYTKG